MHTSTTWHHQKTRLIALLTILAGGALVAWVLLHAAPPAQAATNTVTTLADSGAGSLRETIAQASDGDTITFAVSGTIGLTSGPIDITSDLVIQGPGAEQLAISGSNTNPVLTIAEGATVTIAGVTIRDGFVPPWNSAPEEENAVGIQNNGTLHLTGTFVLNNPSRELAQHDRVDYGIVNSGLMTITHSTIRHNGGHGIENWEGTLTISDSTIANNGSGGVGTMDGALTITQSTIRDNDWSGIFTTISTIYIMDSTITDNGFHGVFNFSRGTMTMINSTVSGNSPNGIESRKAQLDIIEGTIRDNAVHGVSNNGGFMRTINQSAISRDNDDNFFNESNLVTIASSTIHDNGRDGLHLQFTDLNLTDSTIRDNGNSGVTSVSSTTFITNSTISRSGAYGINHNRGKMTVTSSTITDHHASSISQENGTVAVKHTIFDTCSGTLLSHGYNLLRNTENCTLQGDASSNIIGQYHRLAPLADNGSATSTRTPLPSSPAINAIPLRQCAALVDQRGIERPYGAGCDIGAVEKVVTDTVRIITDTDSILTVHDGSYVVGVTAPAESVPMSATFTYTSSHTPAPPDDGYAMLLAFLLEMHQDDGNQIAQLDAPVTVTVDVSQSGLIDPSFVVRDEDGTWRDPLELCQQSEQCGQEIIDGELRLVVDVLGEFALVGEQLRFYLPVVAK